jgi:hypothetical protein
MTDIATGARHMRPVRTTSAVAHAPHEAPATNVTARILLILAQLAALLVVFRLFELENRTVFGVLVLVVIGFAVQNLLPRRFYLPFFAVLSVASVYWVLGFAIGSMVLGLGYVFIALAHLPVAFRWRIALMALLGLACLWMRAHTVLPASLDLLWPVLGSMFMFRLALYVHSLYHNDAPHGITWSTAYFFMVPNVVFPLFPVVDYRGFTRAHLDGERFRTYERGLMYMLRGTLHLIFYRFIYYEVALDGQYVNSMADVVRHVVSTFLLYTRVSGQFHLIIGVLCLFGFRLPETNHLYFLARSVTDFWRRVNIYWKDYMLKLVYYPSFFWLRRFGNRVAVIASTILVFIVTWLLHSYQFYWLKGIRLFQRRDIAFWGLFGVFAVAVTLWELRPGRRTTTKTARKWSLTRGIATVGTFCLIATLWSLWSAYSLSTWFFMWSQLANATWTDWAIFAAVVAVAIALAGYGWGAATLDQPHPDAEPLRAIVRSAGGRLATMGCVLLLVWPGTVTHLPARFKDIQSHFRGDGWALVDAAIDNVGYYEVLTKPESRAAVRWRPRVEGHKNTPYYRERNDFQLDDMNPLQDSLFLGQPFRTNSFGMRDQEYTLTKPPGTYRIAVLGASSVFGWGVANGEQFEAVAETVLDSIARARGQRVEVLNFGLVGISVSQEVYQIETSVLRFSPDLIILTTQAYDLAFLQRHFIRVEKAGIPIPDSALAALVRRGGHGVELRPFEEQIDRRLFQWAAELSAKVGARVAVMGLKLPTEWFPGNLATTRRAVAADGIPFLDCTHIWDGTSALEYRVGGRDLHPNRAGHRIVAGCLVKELERHAQELGIRPLLEQAP